MKATKIIFLVYPCMIVVCESSTTPNCKDPETNDLREYAKIQRFSTEYTKAGTLIWTKNASMLSYEQRMSIHRYASKVAQGV